MPVPKKPVTLSDALHYALCGNPKTRQAWEALKAQTARLGQARSAYWPALNGTVQYNRDQANTTVHDYSQLDSDQISRFRSETFSLSWLLYDFGARSAATDNARQLLLASRFSLDDAVQSAFLNTAKDYYAAVAAWAALRAALKDEQTARDSLAAARARVSHGVAAVSDQLQARTAAAQATYRRAKAKGDWRTKRGALAIDMGLDPRTAKVRLAAAEKTPGEKALEIPLSDLLSQAKRINPRLNVARAQHLAALAQESEARDQGWPSLHLDWKFSQNNQPVSPGIGMTNLPSSTIDNFVGVQVDIPLFTGFDRTWKIREACARARKQAAVVDDIRRQVIRNVWAAYEGYRTAAAELQDSRAVEAVAKESLAASRKRYQKGVASILELLSTQSALSDARRQTVQALTGWLLARLQLAYAVGTLGQSVESDSD